MQKIIIEITESDDGKPIVTTLNYYVDAKIILKKRWRISGPPWRVIDASLVHTLIPRLKATTQDACQQTILF